MNQPPLNPDALRRAADELDADMSHCCCGMNGVMQCDYCMGAVESIVTAYLAAALPEVSSDKASTWQEGFEAGWAEAKDPGAFVNDVWDAKTPNPHLP